MTLTSENFFFYVKAYLKRNNIDVPVNYAPEFLFDNGNGVFIDNSKWPFEVSVPTVQELEQLPYSEVQQMIVKPSKIVLDVYPELPAGIFPEGTLILVNGAQEYALYVFIDNQFRLL